MPTKPMVQELSANSVDILNAIRASASTTYVDRIPQATRDNIAEIGNAMMQYQSTQNEFLTALVNRIGRVIITSKMYTNPLKNFKKGMLSFGETVEELFVQIAQAHPYDPVVAEKELFKREIPDVLAVFHRMNYQNFFKATISNDQLRQAFLSYDGITDLIGRIVDSMYTGAELDEYIIMKQLIVDAATQGKIYPVTVPAVSATTAKEIVSTIKGISNIIEFMRSDYNAAGVLTHTRKKDQIFLIDAKFDAVIDVEVLASAFNMDKAEFMGQRVLVDDFASLSNCYAAIVDREWFMIFDNFINFTEQYNAQGLSWNYFYHVWKTFSTSPYSNAIMFITDTATVTSVAVSPKTANCKKGSSVQITATVVVTNYAPQTVSWTITGGTSSTTKVDNTGKVFVGTDETASSLTVTATSTFDNSKSDTSVVTVTA